VAFDGQVLIVALGADGRGLHSPGCRWNCARSNIISLPVKRDMLRCDCGKAGTCSPWRRPDPVSGHWYYQGTIAAAVAKHRERMFYVAAAALQLAGSGAIVRARRISCYRGQ
jgi:hypothetical protein